MAKFCPERQIGVGGLVLGNSEKKYLQEVIQSNRLSYGPYAKRYVVSAFREIVWREKYDG